jgi:hypothetical protein
MITNVGQNMYCVYIDDKEIWKFKAFNGFKKQVAYKMADT